MGRTKIICTMGPAVASDEKLEALIDAGMNVARINFSHGTQAQHGVVIERLKRVREKKKVPLAILLDTKGPEIRLGNVEGGQFSVEKGQKLRLVTQNILGTKEGVQITPSLVIAPLSIGDTVLIDDGYLITKVVEKNADWVTVEFLNPGLIKDHKGVNIPGVNIPLPAMTEQDVSDLKFGVEQGIDLIAASFIRSKEHILQIRKLLTELGAPHVLLLAKIENRLGVEKFDEILEEADGVMVARGDLGVELPLKEVPALQKMMIRKCYRSGKPVVTATQMLESMIKNPRPTRAEVSDVANAIYDSTSAVMLSGETAVGLYPVETVQMMQSIIEETEKDFDYRSFFSVLQRPEFRDVPSSIALAAVQTAYNAQAKGIFCFTHSGFTARHLSSFRPPFPMFALPSDAKTYHQLSLNWGVIPVDPASVSTVTQALQIVSAFAVKRKLLRPRDIVIVTAGSPFGQIGSTNMMLVESVYTESD